jgi:hypothetical protein
MYAIFKTSIFVVAFALSVMARADGLAEEDGGLCSNGTVCETATKIVVVPVAIVAIPTIIVAAGVIESAAILSDKLLEPFGYRIYYRGSPISK